MTTLTAIIGDVHGCLNEFKRLVSLFPSNTRIICAGDLLDKGPNPIETVQYARKIGVECVMGNHEWKHVRKYLKADRGQAEGLTGEIKHAYRSFTEADRAWLNACPTWIEVPGGIVVHAGIPADITMMPYDRYNRSGKYTQVFYVRYVDDKGKMVGNTFKSEEGLRFWADTYDGRFGKVYYGHQPFKRDVPVETDHTVGLDLACVFGGKLCAVLIDGQGKRVDTITVDAESVYSDSYREE